jgi:hypothetical protein
MTSTTRAALAANSLGANIDLMKVVKAFRLIGPP